MKWFNPVPKSVEELKRQYKQLAIRNHPDKGGRTEDMQQINNEYDALFARLKNVHQTAEGKTYQTKENTNEAPEEFREIIEQLIRCEGIKIEIIGSWVWVTGNTYSYKEIYKKMGFRWSKSKIAWFYHRDEYRKTTPRTYSLDKIRDLYGSETINTDPKLKISIN